MHTVTNEPYADDVCHLACYSKTKHCNDHLESIYGIHVRTFSA